jgi:long-chain acyl-CoA synthetase
MANLARIVVDGAHRSAEHPALKLSDDVVTYGQLDDHTARCARLLRSLGVEPGDRVGVMLPNVPQFAVAYYGVLRCGAIVVPMNILLKGRETAFYLSDPEAKAVFAWHEFVDSARTGAEAAGAEVIPVAPGEFERLLAAHEPLTENAELDDDDTAVVLYTSGTTGTPKGAELTHANLYTQAAILADDLFHMTADDVVLGALPLFHAFGQSDALNAPLYAGATVTMLPRFDPAAALETMQRDGTTLFMGVPTMYTAMLHAPERGRFRLPRLRVCCSGGASLPVEVLRGFEREFGCMILEGYGLSETSPTASFNHMERERKPGSIGTPIKGVEMKVAAEDGSPLPSGEVGEIWIRGHNVMKGYWRRPDATAEVLTPDGWFKTGDLAQVDEDGYFYIVDRKKDMIIRGGYNVYPREIEEVLYEHPAVREAAVIGIPHSEYGEEVAAAVALKPGAAATGEELRDFVRQQVAAYKYPRVVWLVDELPKGPTGKILKKEIRAPEQVSAS